MKSAQFPSLNGWRAIAILLVLASHSCMIKGMPWENSIFWGKMGNHGVRLFFTISGFLITWLMLKEELGFKRVSLKNFYIRRTLRIWPVYFSFVFVLAILQWSGVVMQHGYAWRGLLTFTRNFFDEQWPADESTGHRVDGISAHCWSLSIEEQFYLFWPPAFCLIRSQAGRVWLLILAILFSEGFKTICALGLSNPHSHILFQPFSTFNYLDDLAWGCLAAVLLAAKNEAVTNCLRNHGLYLFSVSICLIWVTSALGFGQGIQGFSFAVLLLHSVVKPDWIFYRPLNFRWMNRIGILSYSVYIWQQFVFGMWPHELVKVWFLWIPSAFGIAWISYEFLEKPFFSLRARFRDARHPAP